MAAGVTILAAWALGHILLAPDPWLESISMLDPIAMWRFGSALYVFAPLGAALTVSAALSMRSTRTPKN